jgi:Spy/CpxP family protein refolding chaperone
MPSPKKGPHAFDGAGPRGGFAANDRDGHPGGPPDKKGGGGHDQGIFGKGPLDLTALNLTDEQKQKIGQMHSENGAKMRDLMRKRRDLSMQMKDIMFGADVTDAQIRAKRDEVRQVQEKLEDLRLNDFLGIRSVLTAEQKQKLKDVKIANNRPRDGEGPPPPPNQVAKRENPDQKRLADTPSKKDEVRP